LGSANVQFECIKCGACCKNRDLLVTLTGRDLVKIAITLGLNAEEMLRAIDFYVQAEGNSIPEGLKHIPQISTEAGLATIALKKNDDGDCIFLKDDLCMIHEIRPGACASFPFVFTRDSAGINWGLSAMKEICPGLGEGPDVKESDLLEIAAGVLEELEIYREFTKDWNVSDHSHSAEKLLTLILSDIRFIV
jgi:Fe-S-cluster containining protein